MKSKIFAAVLLLLLCGCTVCSRNRVFPKLAFYWSHDAQVERQERRQEEAWKAGNTNWSNVK